MIILYITKTNKIYKHRQIIKKTQPKKPNYHGNEWHNHSPPPKKLIFQSSWLLRSFAKLNKRNLQTQNRDKPKKIHLKYQTRALIMGRLRRLMTLFGVNFVNALLWVNFVCFGAFKRLRYFNYVVLQFLVVIVIIKKVKYIYVYFLLNTHKIIICINFLQKFRLFKSCKQTKFISFCCKQDFQ